MALQVIGLVLKVISMAPMLASMMPDKTDRETNIRIGVGTSITKDANTGVFISEVTFFEFQSLTSNRW